MHMRSEDEAAAAVGTDGRPPPAMTTASAAAAAAAVSEGDIYHKLEAMKDIRTKTIALERLKRSILNEVRSGDQENRCLAQYRREMELLQQEKMSHVEELRQIHADINASVTAEEEATWLSFCKRCARALAAARDFRWRCTVSEVLFAAARKTVEAREMEVGGEVELDEAGDETTAEEPPRKAGGARAKRRASPAKKDVISEAFFDAVAEEIADEVPEAIADDVVVSTPDGGPYGCVECKKSFSSARGLKSHSLSHLVLKRYACPSCARRFASEPSLRAHEKEHAKAKTQALRLLARARRCLEAGGTSLAEHLTSLGELKHLVDASASEALPKRAKMITTVAKKSVPKAGRKPREAKNEAEGAVKTEAEETASGRPIRRPRKSPPLKIAPRKPSPRKRKRAEDADPVGFEDAKEADVEGGDDADTTENIFFTTLQLINPK